MYKNIKKKWTDALRSGKYKQCRGNLREPIDNSNDFSYCCLGVLCDIYAKEKKKKFPKGFPDLLDKTIIKWAGFEKEVISNSYGGYSDVYIGEKFKKKSEVTLSKLNDTKKYSFKKIATYIDKYL